MRGKYLSAYGECADSISKKSSGGYLLAENEQFKNIIFWISLKQKLLYAHTETTLNGEISTESVYISVNNNTNFKKI